MKIVQMIKVLDKVKEEREKIFDYPDEAIFSNLYYISLSHSLRSFSNLKEEVREKWLKDNEWLTSEVSAIQNIPILDFDNITKILKNGKKSCDGLFYNYSPLEEQQHFLIELKNVGKRDLLRLLKSNGDDGIFNKVSDSAYCIKNQLEFGGSHEKENLIQHTHFLVVYGGKNNVPTLNSILMPQKTRVKHDTGNKQKRAARMSYGMTEKEENEIYTKFGQKIKELGFQECDENVFPGDALPRANKSGKGRKKSRPFSVFSATDFAEIINNDFFSEWNWGEYLEENIEDERIVEQEEIKE